MTRLHVFHTGSVIVDRAIPYHEDRPLAALGVGRSVDKKLTLPVSCYLIEHPRGNILIDTGWNTRYAYERPKRFGGALDRISAPLVLEGEGIDSKLAACGLSPTDIDCVYLSHLDFDHTSGIALVRGARRFMTARAEVADARRAPLRYVRSTWADVDIEPFDYQEGGIGPVGRSLDVFGDGSVVLVSTPGHTHGHASVRVGTPERYVLLAGDAVYTQRSVREHIMPGFTVDEAAAKASVEWVCACAADPACLTVIPNHDPDTEEQVIDL
ncbi:MAG: N-acyl homoserine lactonase family protein [Atopobiaceae bacterium]|jgi:glyoxylase-like metal-dependent hydrolase (beta-lactamase superfamily II)|nr:N-acyl homoserine lactonase family protein [Atopobiaceae bacterium]MCH4181224.1 N-acyl homoserine lactonase family protein [Atopobiaceae bacterium]MCH4214644.1 N-acyl homoserine lactonase family protein [Atopobiaceae bacterium]MCH4230149.1 N-acyl homoserine lactonase family protein [Atopobiaceae bacterium]MCH4275761.1 N-acyl homoserine lactonase family protein [Atopobiaceae bacterium]